eukprot:1357236-Prymnesium_polylepis.1
MLNFSRDGDRTVATFSRNLFVSSAASSISVPITNTTLGLIFARGSWSGDHPNQHQGTAGRWQANFHKPGPAPGPPAPPTPAPPAPPPTRRAGVWPLRFDARLKMAPSQVPTARLHVKLGSRLRIVPDFVKGRFDVPGMTSRVGGSVGSTGTWRTRARRPSSPRPGSTRRSTSST